MSTIFGNLRTDFLIIAAIALVFGVATLFLKLRQDDPLGAMKTVMTTCVCVVLCGIAFFCCTMLSEKEAAIELEAERLEKVMREADGIVTDKFVSNGLFNTRYFIEITYFDPDTDTDKTKRIAVSQEQYNSIKINDRWNYESDR